MRVIYTYDVNFRHIVHENSFDMMKKDGTHEVMLALMAGPKAEEQRYEDKQQALIRNLSETARAGKELGLTVSVEDTPNIDEGSRLLVFLDELPRLDLKSWI